MKKRQKTDGGDLSISVDNMKAPTSQDVSHDLTKMPMQVTQELEHLRSENR